MSTPAIYDQADTILTGEVTAHLEAQLVAARRLLGVVLEQGAAIRNRDVRSVVQLTGLLQAELHRRRLLENERMLLLARAGVRLGSNPASITVGMLETVMDPESAQLAAARSAELRGLLEEIRREHYVNRALMSQELAFLDHLLKLAGLGGDESYNAGGDRLATTAADVTGHRVLDLEV
ncbi:MAG TPA: flagellar export chaperone FlgN [Solirubrobacteraceae bacterium]|nr:flagellar export chaperone FlgN [Solirubrobacteraceae bacterium]